MTVAPQAPLGDLTEPGRTITYGVVKPGPEQEGGILFVRGSDVRAGRIAFDELRTITPSVSGKYKRTLLRGGELLVSLVGNPGEVAIAPESLAGANIARQVGLIALCNEINSRYVMYYLMSPGGRADLFVQTGGAVQQVINLSDLKRIPIPVPSRSQQDRITEILSTYDDLIDINLRRIALLEDAARHLHEEWFVRLRFPGHEHTPIRNGIPEGWEPATFGDLCVEVKNLVAPADVEPDTPYIGLGHMPRRSITLSSWGRAEEVTSTKHRYREGDIIFGKIRPYFHKVGIAFTDGVTSSDAIVIRPLDKDLWSLVLMAASSDPFVAATSQAMREGSKMPRADWKLMKQYPVPKPPSGLLATFSESVVAIAGQLKNLTFQNQKLRAARDMLLPKLMSGEMTV